MIAALAMLVAASTSSSSPTPTPTTSSNSGPTTTSSSTATTTTTTSPTSTSGALAVNELPAVANDPAVRLAMRGTPASLPPVTAQMFRIGGRLEAQPMFQFSIGDPFFRSILLGLRVEQHLDERWSVAAHALGGSSLLSAPIDWVFIDRSDAADEWNFSRGDAPLVRLSHIQAAASLDSHGGEIG